MNFNARGHVPLLAFAFYCCSTPGPGWECPPTGPFSTNQRTCLTKLCLTILECPTNSGVFVVRPFQKSVQSQKSTAAIQKNWSQIKVQSSNEYQTPCCFTVCNARWAQSVGRTKSHKCLHDFWQALSVGRTKTSRHTSYLLILSPNWHILPPGLPQADTYCPPRVLGPQPPPPSHTPPTSPHPHQPPSPPTSQPHKPHTHQPPHHTHPRSIGGEGGGLHPHCLPFDFHVTD